MPPIGARIPSRTRSGLAPAKPHPKSAMSKPSQLTLQRLRLLTGCAPAAETCQRANYGLTCPARLAPACFCHDIVKQAVFNNPESVSQECHAVVVAELLPTILYCCET